MYKAFNTFIDDLFAFIITMPTAHRVACFRDDVVFVIYLYQVRTTPLYFILTKLRTSKVFTFYPLKVFVSHSASVVKLFCLDLQRYLYPVDKTRIDASGMIEETTEATVVANKDTTAANPTVRRSKRLKAE